MKAAELNDRFIRDNAPTFRQLGLTAESARDGLTIVVKDADDGVIEIMTDHTESFPFGRAKAFLTGFAFAKSVYLNIGNA